MDGMKVNSTQAVPTDGPLADSLEGQTYIEPCMTSTESMKASIKGK